MTSPYLPTGIQTGGAEPGMEGGGRDVGFCLFGEFISSLLRAFLLSMSGAGDSCDWLLVALLAKNPKTSDTPTYFFNAAVWTLL